MSTMDYATACGALDAFCTGLVQAHGAARGGAMDARVWAEVTGLLDTLNDCVKQYAHLQGLGDIRRWGKDMKFCAETATRILERDLVQYQATFQAHASDFAVYTGNTSHGMTEILQGITEGMKQAYMADLIAGLIV